MSPAAASFITGFALVMDRSNAFSTSASVVTPGGLTLAPGLYTWGSSVTIPTDVTLSGAAEDVWILQISNDLSIAAAQSVILAGGALPENIFWQVAGEVTVHENAHFAGVILSQTGITLQTNASLDGRGLAQSLIALDDNIITVP